MVARRPPHLLECGLQKGEEADTAQARVAAKAAREGREARARPPGRRGEAARAGKWWWVGEARGERAAEGGLAWMGEWDTVLAAEEELQEPQPAQVGGQGAEWEEGRLHRRVAPRAICGASAVSQRKPRAENAAGEQLTRSGWPLLSDCQRHSRGPPHLHLYAGASAAGPGYRHPAATPALQQAVAVRGATAGDAARNLQRWHRQPNLQVHERAAEGARPGRSFRESRRRSRLREWQMTRTAPTEQWRLLQGTKLG